MVRTMYINSVRDLESYDDAGNAVGRLCRLHHVVSLNGLPHDAPLYPEVWSRRGKPLFPTSPRQVGSPTVCRMGVWVVTTMTTAMLEARLA